MKVTICDYIDTIKPELIALSHEIHSNPELGRQEFLAQAAICNLLESKGFQTTKGLGSMETAFIAQKDSGKPGPNIAFFAEYDALAGLGHACGHNVIAACSVGAFLATAPLIEQFCGKVTIIGTPAEETFGGKVTMLNEGAFDGVDFALMIHPSSGKSLINRGGRAATSIEFMFTGKSAHSSKPSSGVNALTAVINMFNSIDALRPTLEFQDNINGVITNGGNAPNVIPGVASCKFSMRAETLHRLKELTEIVKRAAQNASSLVCTQLEISEGNLYAERYPNLPMCEAFKANMETLGEHMEYPEPGMLYGSSDIGNVSIKIPAIHDYLQIAPEGVNAHAKEFADCSASERADEICIKGAKGLAMTALDILSSEQFREQIVSYHASQVPDFYKNK